MGIKFSNNASANIIRALTSTATSVSVTAGKGDLFPSLTEGDYFYATLAGNNGLEIVKVTNRVNDTMTIVRAQDDTTALSFDTGDLFELRIVAADFNDTFSEVNDKLEASISEVNDKLEASIEETTSVVESALSSKAPIFHASSSDEFGAGTSTQYGHLKTHDSPDATLTADTGNAFTPAGAAALQETINKEIDGLAEKVGTVREDTLAAAQQASASGGSGETGSVTLEGVTSEVSRLGVEVARLGVEVAKKARVDASNFSVDGKSHLAELGMPGSSWFTIDAAPATGATYVAPATGWVRAAGIGKSSAHTSIDLSAGSLRSRVIIPTVTSSVSVYLPVKRGDDINLQFTAKDVKLYFIYAKGTE